MLATALTTNYQLFDTAQKYGIPLRHVVSKNLLENIRKKNIIIDGGYIINLQDSHLGGSHWVCVYVEGDTACYFDSFGVSPPIDCLLFMKPYKTVLQSDDHIQNVDSGFCGQYCLSFINFMWQNRKVPIKKRFSLFLNQFSKNPKKNLTILKRLNRFL
jgi:hypothetical protein